MRPDLARMVGTYEQHDPETNPHARSLAIRLLAFAGRPQADQGAAGGYHGRCSPLRFACGCEVCPGAAVPGRMQRSGRCGQTHVEACEASARHAGIVAGGIARPRGWATIDGSERSRGPGRRAGRRVWRQPGGRRCAIKNRKRYFLKGGLLYCGSRRPKYMSEHDPTSGRLIDSKKTKQATRCSV